MKAQILTSIVPTTDKFYIGDSHKHYFSLATHEAGTYLGEVDPVSDEPGTSPTAISLINTAKEFNLEPNTNITWYSTRNFLELTGSVGWHNDKGLGLLLSWVLYETDIPGFSADYNHKMTLMTTKTRLELKTGDIFVFNSDADHAWMSNTTCLLYQIAVKRIKSK